jgi:isopentenyldiphosphate isomerase
MVLFLFQILNICILPQADVKLKQNPEEVMDVKYVTLNELQAMMKPSSGLLWSPWFKIIAEKFLPHWWAVCVDFMILTSSYNIC